MLGLVCYAFMSLGRLFFSQGEPKGEGEGVDLGQKGDGEKGLWREEKLCSDVIFKRRINTF